MKVHSQEVRKKKTQYEKSICQSYRSENGFNSQDVYSMPTAQQAQLNMSDSLVGEGITNLECQRTGEPVGAQLQG